MLPIHRSAVSVFDYQSIPTGYYFKAMVSGSAAQRFWHQYKFQAVAQRLNSQDRILDLGCGPGSFLWTVQKAHPGIHAVGADVASDQLIFARETLAKESGAKNIEFVQISETQQQLPFESGSFDVVSMIELVEHIHPYFAHSILRDVQRVLKPGGRLLITTPNYRSLWPFIEFGLERFGGVKYHDQHINKFTPNAFVKFLESAGYEIKKLRSIFVVAPFLGGLSWKLAERFHMLESKLPGLPGSLLVAEARKGNWLKS